jgi:hypothetical protein
MMYRCPICKQNRTSKLHTDKCSKSAKETLEPTAREERTPENELPLPPPMRTRALNRFRY